MDGRIATLILLNGQPGVGKSTLAGRYLDDHLLALQLELDEIRRSLGGWQERDDSKQVARELVLAMAEAHLRAGHDVILPQHLGRTEFILALEALAERCDAPFREVRLVDGQTRWPTASERDERSWLRPAEPIRSSMSTSGGCGDERRGHSEPRGCGG